MERSEPLDLIIQKGTYIGATLSPALLESIFYPGNPLHDGAVLIRENQVVSAANVLPLTKTVISGKKLGTRHRAAIGLSEQSDALVLVVSEETGKISFAFNGKLYPDKYDSNNFMNDVENRKHNIPSYFFTLNEIFKKTFTLYIVDKGDYS